MSRRALGLAAALAALLLACAGRSSPTFTVLLGAARTPAPAPAPLAGPVVRVLHVADFGDPTPQQAAISDAMGRDHQRAPFALALFPGDNIYECGPDPLVAGADRCAFAADGNTVAPGFRAPADAMFARHERALAALGASPPRVLLSLGNHDVHACGMIDRGGAIARRKACLEVAHASPVWSMPARHYLVDEGPARFIFFDSNLLVGDYGGFSFEDEVAFVAEAARGCDQRTCFLVAHHPPVTAGSHVSDAKPRYLERTARILSAGGGRIRGWLAGHDHDLQHLRTTDGLDVMVSGNGSRVRDVERFEVVSVPGASLLFASVRWGYAVLEVGQDGWRYRFEGADGAPLHCCAARGAGPCEPVSCR